MARTRIAALALAATTLVASSGCGNGSKSHSSAQTPGKTTAVTTSSAVEGSKSRTDTNSGSAPLKRSELIARADRICKGIGNKRASGEIRRQQDVVRLAAALSSYEMRATDELSKLTPPAPLSNDWNAIVTGIRMIASNTAKIGHYTEASETSAAHAVLVSSVTIEQHINKLAARDGFKECSRAV